LTYNFFGNFATNPRQVGDFNGDGLDDVIGFNANGVVKCASNGNDITCKDGLKAYGTKGNFKSWNENYRLIGDINGDKKADIVGFGYAEVYGSISKGNSFANPKIWTK